MKVFPVELKARPTFTRDWRAPRSGGRSHAGTDIFAPRGTPVLAVADGRIWHSLEEKGGNVVYLQEPTTKTKYFFGHLDSFAGTAPRQVRAGEVIGFVGDTGNARGLAPHLHFEVHPGGGAAVDPYEALERLARSGGSTPRGASAKATESRLAAKGAGGIGLLFLLWAISKGVGRG